VVAVQMLLNLVVTIFWAVMRRRLGSDLNSTRHFLWTDGQEWVNLQLGVRLATTSDDLDHLDALDIRDREIVYINKIIRISMCLSLSLIDKRRRSRVA